MTFNIFDDHLNNGNGQVLEDRVTYQDLIEELEYDRGDMIRIIVESKIEYSLFEGSLILDMLIELHRLNDIEYPAEYYLQDDEVLKQEYYNAVYSFYDSMTNEEIVQWFKDNEPYVFSMQLQFEKLL
jgi:hypothetical protein